MLWKKLNNIYIKYIMFWKINIWKNNAVRKLKNASEKTDKC